MSNLPTSRRYFVPSTNDSRRFLAADLAAVRTDTRPVGRGLIDGAARDQAMGNELSGLRQAVEAERTRAEGLQLLVDELKSSVAATVAAESDREAAPEPGAAPPFPPALQRVRGRP